MKPHELVFLTSAFACILTWAMFQTDRWCYNHFMHHQRSNVIRWAFIISAVVFAISLCYNAYLEWF